MDFVQRVAAYVEEHDLLGSNQGVVVGVSGGPDSLCLLDVLRQLSGEALPGLSIHVAHLNHGLREAEGQADAEFVARLAAKWGLPATIETADVRRLGGERRLSLEEAGRQARYAFLARVAQQTGAQAIAVAHNADDQAETVLMHFLRGSGVAGLRGMRPKSALGDWRLEIGDWASLNPQLPITNLSLVRPLLATPRAEIEAYCAEHDLQPRLDRSNLDTTFFRNRLRHEVLPALEKVSPGLRARLLRMAEVMAGDHATLEQILGSARALAIVSETPSRITFDLAAFRSLPSGVQRRLIRDAVAQLRADLRDIAFQPVEAAVQLVERGRTGARASLPGGLSLSLGYDTATLAVEDAVDDLSDIPLLPSGVVLPVAVPGITVLPGSDWVLRAETGDWPLAEVYANAEPWQAFVRWEAATPDGLSLRTRRPGDRFQPQGMSGAAPKLSDFMIAQKVPRAWRERLPLLVQGDEIVWVCGWRVSESAVLRAGTENVLRLQFERVRRLS